MEQYLWDETGMDLDMKLSVKSTTDWVHRSPGKKLSLHQLPNNMWTLYKAYLPMDLVFRNIL